MEEQQPTSQQFPAPPPFWQSFTPDNIERISSMRETLYPTNNLDPATALPPRLLDLPVELRCLQPPDQPADGKYRCFGALYDIQDPLPSLQEMGVQQLYTPPASPSGKHNDHSFTLKRIMKSLLLNYLELIGIMAINPFEGLEKIQDLRILFVNFHHLLNEYRPHQARESLIVMMQDQLEKIRAETKASRDITTKVKGVLGALAQAKLAEEEVVMEKTEVEAVEEAKYMWDALDKEFLA